MSRDRIVAGLKDAAAFARGEDVGARVTTYPTTSYGFHWRFTERDGTRHQGSDTGYWERDDMLERRAALLKSIGWTPPLWWQWWRWGDYPRQIEPKQPI